MSNRPIYCWDTNVIVAWLKDETSAPIGDIELVIREIDAGEAVLLLSVLVYSEVLEAHYTPEQMAKFRSFLQKSNVEIANVTQPIADKSGQIRNRGLEVKPKKVSIKTPDATVIATAIIYKASVLHTLETGGWAALGGTSLVDGLKITQPKPLRGASSLFNPSSTAPPTPS